MFPILNRGLRPLGRRLALAGAAFVVAACSATSPTPTPAPASSGASPGGSGQAGCATGTAPASVPGWTATAKSGALVPTLISSEQVCGRNRLVFGFSTIATDSSGQQVAVSAGSPDLAASVALYDLSKDPAKPTMTANGRFEWAIEGKTGIYVADVTYPDAGDWGAEFTTTKQGEAPQTTRVRYQVQPDGVMPGLGDSVPAVKTPTAADVKGDLRQISTDPAPNSRFYQMSEDQAIAQHKPFVMVFATPAFCTSQICGPTLNKLKDMASAYPDMTFINVEPYQMTWTGDRLQPVLDANGQLQPNDASKAFTLLSEPWIFVVDGNGHVTGSFEVIVGPDELKSAIAAASQ